MSTQLVPKAAARLESKDMVWNHITRTLVERNLDHLVRPTLRLFGRPLPTFKLCGYSGFVLGFMQSMLLVNRLGLSPLTLLGITGVVILTFSALMTVTKLIARDELIIYYHHQIAVLAMTELFLRLTHQPVLPYLDVSMLGIGLFHACGRIGCLMVGCCHGRPCKWGITYSHRHAEEGFPSYLVGVRLFPVQAVESVFVLCAVVSGTLLVLKYPPGTAFAFYVVAYASGRFCFEFARGDAERPYLWGFSEAQWTSLLLALAVAGTERAKILPPSKWHWAVAGAMGVSIILISMWRYFDGSHRFQLLHPRHVREIIGAVNHLELSWQQAEPDSKSSRWALRIHVVRTSLGYRISGGRSVIGSRTLKHYSLSRDGESISLRAAEVLSHLFACLEESPDSLQLIRGREGVFHILLDVSGDAPPPRAQYPENPGARLQPSRSAM